MGENRFWTGENWLTKPSDPDWVKKGKKDPRTLHGFTIDKEQEKEELSGNLVSSLSTSHNGNVTHSSPIPVAGFWMRGLAWIVDGLLFYSLFYVLSIGTYAALVHLSIDRTGHYRISSSGQSEALVLAIVVALILIPFLLSVYFRYWYERLSLEWWSATPGQAICGLRTISVGYTYAKTSGIKQRCRYFAWYNFAMIVPFVNIYAGFMFINGCLTIFSDPLNRANQDRMSATLIVWRGRLLSRDAADITKR
jgi:hypothetical protein